jgi:NAD(P)-dependent dehydrogenase (short-subunit alcohol dehydrogenase family)
MMNHRELEGRVALVTGVSRRVGIGAAIARDLARGGAKGSWRSFGQGRGPMPGELAYVVTKAALGALTVTLSAELTSRSITVNAVDPGPTDTGWNA